MGRMSRAAVSLLAAILWACASVVPKLQPPQVAVMHVDFLGGTGQQQQIRLLLHVTNPNDHTISIRGIDCDLDLAGSSFAHGESEAAFTLPANGASDVPVDVSADLTNAAVILAATLVHKQIDYHFYGKVHLLGGLLRTIPFEGSGKVRL